jgi:hypothetical protein
MCTCKKRSDRSNTRRDALLRDVRAERKRGRPTRSAAKDFRIIFHILALYCNKVQQNDINSTSPTFSPRCSHTLPLLDVSLYGPIKTYVNRAWNAWVTKHPDHTLALYDIPGNVNLSFHLVASPGNIKAGFQNLSLWQGYFSWQRIYWGLRYIYTKNTLMEVPPLFAEVASPVDQNTLFKN